MTRSNIATKLAQGSFDNDTKSMLVNSLVIDNAINGDGDLKVSIQDQTTRALEFKFIKTLSQTTLAADATAEDTVILVTSATNMAAGITLGLVTVTGDFYFADIVAVNTLDITMDTPLDSSFLAADTIVIVATKNMNLNGSMATPQVFRVGPLLGATVDITRIMGIIVDDAAMDDGKFGGITALTNGVVFRRTNSGSLENIWNIKTNGDIGLICYDLAYSDKAPAGENSAKFRNTYGGTSKHGVVMRLESGDYLEILVQDNITTNTDFVMMAQGHVVDPT